MLRKDSIESLSSCRDTRNAIYVQLRLLLQKAAFAWQVKENDVSGLL